MKPDPIKMYDSLASAQPKRGFREHGSNMPKPIPRRSAQDDEQAVVDRINRGLL